MTGRVCVWVCARVCVWVCVRVWGWWVNDGEKIEYIGDKNLSPGRSYVSSWGLRIFIPVVWHTSKLRVVACPTWQPAKLPNKAKSTTEERDKEASNRGRGQQVCVSGSVGVCKLVVLLAGNRWNFVGDRYLITPPTRSPNTRAYTHTNTATIFFSPSRARIPLSASSSRYQLSLSPVITVCNVFW